MRCSLWHETKHRALQQEEETVFGISAGHRCKRLPAETHGRVQDCRRLGGCVVFVLRIPLHLHARAKPGTHLLLLLPRQKTAHESAAEVCFERKRAILARASPSSRVRSACSARAIGGESLSSAADSARSNGDNLFLEREREAEVRG